MAREPPDNVSHLPTQRAGNHQKLLTLAVQRVRAGTLPGNQTASLFAGPGRNNSCALCADVITLTEVEYELDSTQSESPAAPVYFHRVCYLAWLQACE